MDEDTSAETTESYYTSPGPVPLYPGSYELSLFCHLTPTARQAGIEWFKTTLTPLAWESINNGEASISVEMDAGGTVTFKLLDTRPEPDDEICVPTHKPFSNMFNLVSERVTSSLHKLLHPVTSKNEDVNEKPSSIDTKTSALEATAREV